MSASAAAFSRNVKPLIGVLLMLFAVKFFPKASIGFLLSVFAVQVNREIFDVLEVYSPSAADSLHVVERPIKTMMTLSAIVSLSVAAFCPKVSTSIILMAAISSFGVFAVKVWRSFAILLEEVSPYDPDAFCDVARLVKMTMMLSVMVFLYVMIFFLRASIGFLIVAAVSSLAIFAVKVDNSEVMVAMLEEFSPLTAAFLYHFKRLVIAVFSLGVFAVKLMGSLFVGAVSSFGFIVIKARHEFVDRLDLEQSGYSVCSLHHPSNPNINVKKEKRVNPPPSPSVDKDKTKKRTPSYSNVDYNKADRLFNSHGGKKQSSPSTNKIWHYKVDNEERRMKSETWTRIQELIPEIQREYLNDPEYVAPMCESKVA